MDVALADTPRPVLEQESLALKNEREALEREMTWQREFNPKRALATIARCIHEASVLNEHIALAKQDLAVVEAGISSVELIASPSLPRARRFSEQAASQRALQDGMARRQIISTRLDDLRNKVKLVFAEAGRTEADLERRRSFDFPKAVRRVLAIEAREAELQRVLEAA
ncbi:hypothetical protein LVB87_09610 [Lysobacter sp. KIS68-7]|uniref:hypothetical protein n=1 Tax=Lysobacter sp. KIS68-7 TaxID=2904252 RepID=UPI001E48423C|nr:hypothetical protein [Lysobacter sp. KIS68-7]UHQ18469.1 hypothetical protein LVB87_09610 [Lysobacter sp. KIS68-7]